MRSRLLGSGGIGKINLLLHFIGVLIGVLIKGCRVFNISVCLFSKTANCLRITFISSLILQIFLTLLSHLPHI